MVKFLKQYNLDYSINITKHIISDHFHFLLIETNYLYYLRAGRIVL